jgi:hypothetical protein
VSLTELNLNDVIADKIVEISHLLMWSATIKTVRRHSLS